ECLTCSGTDAAHHLAVNFYEMLKTGFLPRANPTSLAKVSVVVFLGRRHTVWEFPQQMHVTLQRGEGGQWLAPQLTPLKLQAILEAYAEGMQNEGRKLRGAAK